MVLLVVLLFIEILALALISHSLTQRLFLFFLLLFRARSVAISATTLLFFPGTVVHELSHLFTAEILGVHTGKLTLVPEAIHDSEIQSGSVAIAQTGPFRRAAIGVAPTIIGTLILLIISYVMNQFTLEFFHAFHPHPYDQMLLHLRNGGIPLLLCLYALFAISNTMFSSRQDLKGVFPVLFVLSLLIGAAYVAGLRINLTTELILRIEPILRAITQSLGLVILLNLFILLYAIGGNSLLLKIRKIKISTRN